MLPNERDWSKSHRKFHGNKEGLKVVEWFKKIDNKEGDETSLYKNKYIIVGGF